MKESTGNVFQKSISRVFPIDRNAALLQVLLLTFLGAFAVFLRARLRVPLQIPGHHGLEVMAILIIGRYVSKISIATSISTLAAALCIFIPFLGFKDPFLPAIYIIMGITIDMLYNAFKQRKHLVIFAIIGAVGYMMIPISRIILTLLTGYPYKSLIKNGFLMPVATHFLFGLLGAILGAGLIISIKRLKKDK